MQTVLTIKDSLWNEALKCADTYEENELITLALTEFIQHHRDKETAQALLESQSDLKQGKYTHEDIETHINELFD